MRLEDVWKSFDGSPVLCGLRAEFPKRGTVGVVGASGAGKTTLLRIIAGLERADSGSVGGVPDRVSMQFEDDRLFAWLDVAANVTLVGADEAQAAALLDELGLGDKVHARIAGLSGGQRRRVALARALAYPAPLYLLDEPTARLDRESAALALDAVGRRCAESLVVVATHDEQVIERCDSVIELAPPDARSISAPALR